MRTINSIQTLRALAATSVVAVHTSHDAGIYSNHPIIGAIGGYGAIGVDIFFVISGFIMYVTACVNDKSAFSFIIERLIRIVPLYWIATLAYVLLALMSNNITVPSLYDLTLSLLLIPHANNSGEITTFLHVGWTLVYEMFFYATLAVSIFCRPWHLRVMGAILIVLVLSGVLLQPQSPVAFTYTNPILLEFGAGLGIGYLWQAEFRSKELLGVLMILAAVAMLIIWPLSASAAAPGVSRLLSWGLASILIVAGA